MISIGDIILFICRESLGALYRLEVLILLLISISTLKRPKALRVAI